MSAIRVSGLTEVTQALKELDRKVQKSILRKGLRAGAKVMLSPARAGAPDRTGRIRRNIKVRAGRSSKGRVSISVGVNARDFTGPAFYAAFVLLGHKVGSRRLGNKRTSVPANNFLERAFDQAHQQATDVAVQTMANLIEQQAGK
jgi:HK97 gp10 family phage protein